ncbi:MAG: hypothetical protein LAT77_10495 [Aliidiomarina sp.]|uniref:hypothetical protein n=1 Tax=Aliidiomarina sp. TaxID=1872439 RepID=UPI0025C5F3AF|nr:hypothetical protein [Aliidiomarina sp.]MCH8502324.1 hypothetical protein [Aliidiomarina sp.]
MNLADLAEHLQDALEKGSEPEWSLASKGSWNACLNKLVDQSPFPICALAVMKMKEKFSSPASNSLLSDLIHHAAIFKPLIPFQPIAGRDVVVHKHPTSKKVLLVFCGNAFRVGIPLIVAHQWFGSLNITVIYLFDYSKRFYFHGLQSVGGSFEETIEYLKSLFESVGVSEVYCCGSSAGGYSAIRAALALGAKGALVFSAPTNLTADFLIEHGINQEFLPLVMELPDHARDLRLEWMQSACHPSLSLYFGAENDKDRLHAENLAGLDHVKLIAMKGQDAHNIVPPMVFSGQWGHAVRNLVTQ